MAYHQHILYQHQHCWLHSLLIDLLPIPAQEAVATDRQEWWKPARLAVPESQKHTSRKPVPQERSTDDVYDSSANER